MASISQVSLRPIVYYEFLQGHPARSAAGNICAAFKEDVIHYSTVSRWYERFESGDITLEDALIVRAEADTRMLVKTLDCDQATIVKHLYGLGYSKIVSTWVPDELRGSDKACRLGPVCERYTTMPMDPTRRTATKTGKSRAARKGGYSMLLVGFTENASPRAPQWCHSDGRYLGYQLRRLANAIREKRPEQTNVCLLHDIARQHTAKANREKIQECGWEVLPHFAYSPDLASSDYHLFPAFESHLQKIRFNNQHELETEVSSFFDAQPPELWRRGVEKLPERRAKFPSGDYSIEDENRSGRPMKLDSELLRKQVGAQTTVTH
ncbi:hypothetical protein ANCCEY_10075 [Ancylostoma ceylanicum]|uniref:Mos1 transposase HTH domain-containing protein n=1 Tax=Ancylostoma ceylanicum TaxID=53326 RepID=A0A0D6LT79_9BILA|nr:hypothetical protein ANCCEY_10075 [Ancylostoma ceylanicum]